MYELQQNSAQPTHSAQPTLFLGLKGYLFTYYNYLATAENSVQPTLFSVPWDVG
jgi:hypothetical protein